MKENTFGVVTPFYYDHNGKLIKVRPKKKRHIIGIGYPWYADAFGLKYNEQLKTILPTLESNHGFGVIKLYSHPFIGQKEKSIPEIIMLDPKATHNRKKYKLILEEV